MISRRMRWRASAPIDEVAATSAVAAESALRGAIADPALTQTVWLLTQLPLAARSTNFETALRGLGLRIDAKPRLLDLVSAVTEAVDRRWFGRSWFEQEA